MTGRELSYIHCGSETPLIYQTIGARFDQAAALWPDREAFVVCDQRVRLTFSEMKRHVDRLAAGLMALGLQPGDRVGIWSPNNAAWVLTQYATAKAGLILVNINPAYRVAELEFALKKVDCRALITADRFKTSDYIGMLRELAPEIDISTPGQLRATRLPHLQIVIHLADTDEPGFLQFDSVQHLGGSTELARLEELATTLQPDDPINWHHRLAQGGDPNPPQHTEQCLLPRSAHGRRRG
jgi:fatty-acyl-CoA synthase